MSSLNQYGGASTEAVSLGLALLNIDGSGNMMKLSQMLKTYSRFRFLDINHGVYLKNYFEHSAAKFDPPSTKSKDEVIKSQRKFYQNMIRYAVALDPLDSNKIRIGFYAGSWIIKVIGYLLL